MRKYLKDIRNFEILSNEEQLQLLKQIKNGDLEAKKRLFLSNLKIVVKIAKQYHHLGIDLYDLIQAGNLGLLQAIDNYDFEKGGKFIAYACIYIKGSITRALSKYARGYHLSINKAEKLFTMYKYQNEMSDDIDEESRNQYLMEKMNMNKKQLIELKRSELRMIAMEQLKKNKSISCVHKTYDYMNDFKKLLKQAMDELTSRECYVLNHYYGLNDCEKKGLKEIGKHFNISKERVRQIRDEALIKLKNGSYGVYLSEYLGIL